MTKHSRFISIDSRSVLSRSRRGARFLAASVAIAGLAATPVLLTVSAGTVFAQEETPAQRCARETATYNQAMESAWRAANPGKTPTAGAWPAYVCKELPGIELPSGGGGVAGGGTNGARGDGTTGRSHQYEGFGRGAGQYQQDMQIGGTRTGLSDRMGGSGSPTGPSAADTARSNVPVVPEWAAPREVTVTDDRGTSRRVRVIDTDQGIAVIDGDGVATGEVLDRPGSATDPLSVRNVEGLEGVNLLDQQEGNDGGHGSPVAPGPLGAMAAAAGGIGVLANRRRGGVRSITRPVVSRGATRPGVSLSLPGVTAPSGGAQRFVDGRTGDTWIQTDGDNASRSYTQAERAEPGIAQSLFTAPGALTPVLRGLPSLTQPEVDGPLGLDSAPRVTINHATGAQQTIFALLSPESNHDQEFDLDVPDGGDAIIRADGGVDVVDADGNVVSQVAPPWAFDALGRRQETWYTYNPDTGRLTQHVEPNANALYPIIADPSEEELDRTSPNRQPGFIGPVSPEDEAGQARNRARAGEPVTEGNQHDGRFPGAVYDGDDELSRSVRAAQAEPTQQAATPQDRPSPSGESNIPDHLQNTGQGTFTDASQGTTHPGWVDTNGNRNFVQPDGSVITEHPRNDGSGHIDWTKTSANGAAQSSVASLGWDKDGNPTNVELIDNSTVQLTPDQVGDGGNHTMTNPNASESGHLVDNEDGTFSDPSQGTTHPGRLNPETGGRIYDMPDGSQLVEHPRNDGTGESDWTTISADGKQQSAVESLGWDEYGNPTNIREIDRSTVPLTPEQQGDGENHTVTAQSRANSNHLRNNGNGTFTDTSQGTTHQGFIDPETGGRNFLLEDGSVLIEIPGQDGSAQWWTINQQGELHRVESLGWDGGTGAPQDIVTASESTSESDVQAIIAQELAANVGDELMGAAVTGAVGTTAADASRWSRAGRILGRVGGATGFGFALGTASDVADGMDPDDAAAINAASSAAGLAAGAGATWLTGAALGSTLGSAVPVVGTAAGFIVGAAVGYFVHETLKDRVED